MQNTLSRKLTWLYSVAAALAVVGLGDALYLTVQHLTGKSVRCSITSGCSQVLSSSYAQLAGIPTAAFGLTAYFVAFSLAVLALFGYAWARTFLALLVASMFAATLWLLYLQAFVLRAFCQYCLLSAAVTTTLLVIVLLARQKAVDDQP
jgi:uncharacterized membrane protein